MRNKNVVVVGPAWPLRGGLSTFDERLCLEFNKENSCQILSFSLQYPSVLFPGKTQFSAENAPANTKIDSGINSINPFSWLRCGLKYRKLAPDIMVFRYWMPFMAPCLGSIARIVRANGKTKCIAITDNIIPHEKHFYDRFLTRFFTRQMDGFICMSRSVLNDLNDYAEAKPRFYIPHPMYDNFGPAIPKNQAKRELGLDENVHYLLFFGFIRKYKGLSLLLQAMADSRLSALPVKLIIAGEYYEDSGPYKTLIQSLSLTERVIERTDFIPNSEVYKYFSASDMVVQTYLDATQSGVTQVAYHFDKPMLVTNVGGLSELVPDGEVGYVVPKDPGAIADAIVDFYSNNREQGFLANIPAQKTKFTWNALLQAICNAAYPGTAA